MPSASYVQVSGEQTPKPLKRLVLCFDGTGNTFSGSTADTNIVKLFDKFDRDDDLQYHYYQTGIGTYTTGGGSLNQSFFGRIRSSFEKTIDQGLATSFDAHVISGYRFIMQHYEKGDKIYMFGFSRGAYTARFLSRMVRTVGLLSKGNEEMIPFAYKLYQDYENNKLVRGYTAVQEDPETDTFQPDDSPHMDESQRSSRDGLMAFTNTFCRREMVLDDDHKPVLTFDGKPQYRGVKIFFLGLFDCVGSVAVLENPFSPPPGAVQVVGTAQHVRHAVAVDERRVKFKAALLAQDISIHPPGKHESRKEVWFPGNHGDVGGGWPAPQPSKSRAQQVRTWSQWFRKTFLGVKAGPPSVNNGMDPYQMSDIPLSWMIRELEALASIEKPEHLLSWNSRLDGFKNGFKKNIEQARSAASHDTMRIGGGSSWLKAVFWNILDLLPFMPRQELENGKWVRRMLLPNFGDTRDIPTHAVIHRSVLDRLNTHSKTYKPNNNHGQRLPPCLNVENITKVPSVGDGIDDDEFHQLYQFQAAVRERGTPEVVGFPVVKNGGFIQVNEVGASGWKH